MVSILMCCHNSRALLPLAIASYLSQTWADKELVVVNDGDPVEDLFAGIPNVQFHGYPAENLSQKRNFGIRQAKGDIICQFDSDDWSGPERIRHQVEGMGGKKVCGYSKAWWFDMRSKQATYASCGLWGATLCYERQWALEHPWNEASVICEDARFLEAARAEGTIAEMDGGENFVALAHAGNRARPFGQRGWEVTSNENLPTGFRSCYTDSTGEAQWQVPQRP